MNDILAKAKTKQREYASTSVVTIRLSMLQDMIAEIERLEDELQAARDYMDTPGSRDMKIVK